MNWKLWGAIVAAVAIWKARDIRQIASTMGEGWSNLHPEVKKCALIVLKEANEVFAPEGLTVGMYEGWRTREKQIEYLQNGTSWTGDPDSSYHRWGLAVDFVFIDRFGNWTWEPKPAESCPWYNPFCDDSSRALWDKLGDIIEGAGFEWGGRFSTYDGPHGQLRLMKISELKAAYGTPENYV